MSVYAIVSQDNRVLSAPVNLVTRYKDVLAFHLLTDEQRKQHGWYPCVVLNESYNPINFNRSEPIYSFDGEVVTVNYEITPKPQVELDAQLANIKREKISYVDETVDRIIQSEAGARTEEYKIALQQAKEWTDNNYEGPAPIAVMADTLEGVRDEVQAAKRILDKAQEYNDRLLHMRYCRLQAKNKISIATTYEEVIEIADDFLQKLHNKDREEIS